ncbi:hypothetical protein FA13DRAFT_351394 [Coprinellus micaceus]|uniref:Uncharacterized protein n=1 Tax=Coprinellus micaceus TaxID=71717 RepID=A0A4Y7TAL0_COPMI|nr:hypothetical protein FA13DRAFT_351394 [Coprinellus micaceus]
MCPGENMYAMHPLCTRPRASFARTQGLASFLVSSHTAARPPPSLPHGYGDSRERRTCPQQVFDNLLLLGVVMGRQCSVRIRSRTLCLLPGTLTQVDSNFVPQSLQDTDAGPRTIQKRTSDRNSVLPFPASPHDGEGCPVVIVLPSSAFCPSTSVGPHSLSLYGLK